MIIHNLERIEDILNKYMWDLKGYSTNRKIYKDLLKELPELKHIHINLYDILDIKEWVEYVHEADKLRKKIEDRNKIIDSIING